PGGVHYPATGGQLAQELLRIAGRFGLHREQVQAVWSLLGMETDAAFRELVKHGEFSPDNLSGTDFPRRLVRWFVRHEWATMLDDLVERRLMLLYHPRLSRQTLSDLADELVAVEKLSLENKPADIERVCNRLQTRFGKMIE